VIDTFKKAETGKVSLMTY